MTGRNLIIQAPFSPRRFLARAVASIGRFMLGLARGLIRFVLVVIIETAVVLLRFVLWFRWLFLWLGVFVVVMTLLNHAMAPSMWRPQVVGFVGGLGLVAVARASLLIDESLNRWQRRLRL
ncbi:hypothetical protein [Acidiphilium iwatense]|uniref:Phage holin family protein n=1 Tax=Acidiphilium iwatense TaxID=768198 RepID=A0ABS9E1E8_9PROT|nr:hypothetical protein [Acidiphilium iwatense]MCF3948183.1 hypothetical protein [Acidiphilium iwatense]